MERGSLITIIGIKRAINFVTASACQFHETIINLISMLVFTIETDEDWVKFTWPSSL